VRNRSGRKLASVQTHPAIVSQSGFYMLTPTGVPGRTLDLDDARDKILNWVADYPSPDRGLPALSNLHGVPLIDAQMTVGRRKKRRIDSYLLAMTNKVADNVLDFDRAATLEIPEHGGCQR